MRCSAATFERAAREATPNLITIMGAPGVGKTRLVREFWHALGAVSPVPLRHTGRCLPYGSGITYWPLAEVLKEHFGLLENDQQEQIHRRLGDQHVLGLTLGLEVAGLPPFAAQEALHEAWVGFISSLAREQQVIILIEDLHWGDDALLDLLERLVGEVEGPLMLLGTARPELLGGRAAWGAGRRNTSLVWLEPLASTDVERMLSNVVGELPDALRSRVVERAEGNPLFVEELLEALIDQGVLDRTSSGWTVRDVPQGALPDSLNALLAARIDLLETVEKDALQAAAVIGRTFWEGAIRELANGEEPDFGVLEERDFVTRRPGSTLPDEREYVIKHALTRDVAYGAIPKAKRARLHAAFAEWLERTTAGRDEHAAILAHHYGESVRSEDIDLAWQLDADELRRLREKAIRWRRRAAEVAVARGELSETPALAHPALELLDQLPRTPELAQEELALQMLLGVSFSATKGFAAPEAGSAYARARELCQQAGDTPQLFPVLFGLWSFYLVRGELRTARELADRMRALALAAGDPALLLESENMLGATLYFQGEHDQARKHLGEALALYKPELHHAHAFEYGQDPGVFSLTNIALVEAVLGLDEEATRASEHAIELARSHGHFYSLTFALTLGAVLTQFQRDAPSTSKRAKEALELATEYAFPQLAAWAAALVGWVHAEQGQPLEGATAMRESVEASKAMGAELTLPYFLGLLAETCDAPDEALASLGLVDEALAGRERRGEHLWEAELLRIRGRLQISLGLPEDARASFERGAEVASSQGAKLFELHLKDELEGRAMQRL